MLFNVRYHLLLKGQIFEHGFNHQIAVCKPTVVGGASDHREDFIAIAGLDMAAFHFAIKVLPAVLQRVVDALRIDIFDTYGQFAFAGGDKRDASAHQPTTQNPNGAQRSRFSFTARIFFNLRAGKENAAQRLRLRRHRQLAKRFRFRGITAAAALG